MRKQKSRGAFVKVVDERFTLTSNRGGGAIKIEAWEDNSGEIVKYNITYINHRIFQGDNGRVVGYDNAHGYHHKHYLGEISSVDDFMNYEQIVERFENDIKEYLT